MTTARTAKKTTVHYPPAAIARAKRAVRCSAFRLPLFTTMQWQGVSLKEISATSSNPYLRRPLSELAVDGELLWLMQVGLMRREVDGQGLTDSYRLTPLGRQLVTLWETQGFPEKASFKDHLINALNRWLRIPVWLS